MSRIIGIPINPFDGVAASGKTSNPVPLHDTFDWTFSFRTTEASPSTVTLQLSNASGGINALPEASWSNWTRIGQAGVALSGATWHEGPLGARYLRFIRSDASQVLEINKLTR